MSLHFMFQTIKYMFAQDKSHAIQERNKEILTHLKFISTFQPGEKINVASLHIESNTIITPIKRMFMGESRDTTLQFINNTIDRSFEIIQSLSYSESISEKILCTSIITDLIKCVTGLKNIQKTYKEDKLFGCTIDTMIDTIQAKCTELKLRKPDLFPKEEEKKVETSQHNKEIIPDIEPQIPTTNNKKQK